MLVTEVKSDETCVDFCKMLLTKQDLHKKTHNSERHSSFVFTVFSSKDDNDFIVAVVSTSTV
jgi:hypothetical protein